jgi:hypothetical protein
MVAPFKSTTGVLTLSSISVTSRVEALLQFLIFCKRNQPLTRRGLAESEVYN